MQWALGAHLPANHARTEHDCSRLVVDKVVRCISSCFLVHPDGVSIVMEQDQRLSIGSPSGLVAQKSLSQMKSLACRATNQPS